MKKPLKMVVFFKMFEKCLNVTKEKVLYLNIASVYNSSLKFFINYNYYHYFIHVLDLLKCCLLSKSALTDLFQGMVFSRRNHPLRDQGLFCMMLKSVSISKS